MLDDQHLTRPLNGVFRGVLIGVLCGGLLAGTLDIAYAVGRAVLNGKDCVGVLQSVGSGVLGAAAFQGGVGTALFGLLCHFVLALGASAVFGLAFARSPWLQRQFWLAAVGFGVGVYVVMHGVVVPLSAVPFKFSHTPEAVLQGLAVHIGLVGLPIALCVRWSLAKASMRAAKR
jgi:hypothetical protein